MVCLRLTALSLATSSHRGFLRQNTSLARLAVLLVLSAAHRLVFWQSRAIAALFAKILRWLRLAVLLVLRLAALSFGKVEPL